jgi:nucleotide-binding universal stress UspA family protein
MKILLATDGSEYAEYAAKFLTHFNFSYNDEFTIVHVITDISFIKEDAALYYASLKKIKEDVAPEILDSTVSILQPLNVKISTALLVGYSDKAIIDAAANMNADLIVMGSRGLKGIKSLLIGSTARSVTINSAKPVLIVKPGQMEAAASLKVLYATDGSEYSVETGRLLSSMPFQDNTEVTVLSVIGSTHIDIPDRYRMAVDDRIKQAVAGIREREYDATDRIIEQAVSIINKRFKKVETMIKLGDPSVEILNAAEELKTNIIAAGSSGMRGIKGVLGSVSRTILGQAECPVLIGKGKK